jgi:hypothetical protein
VVYVTRLETDYKIRRLTMKRNQMIVGLFVVITVLVIFAICTAPVIGVTTTNPTRTRWWIVPTLISPDNGTIVPTHTPTVTPVPTATTVSYPAP